VERTQEIARISGSEFKFAPPTAMDNTASHLTFSGKRTEISGLAPLDVTIQPPLHIDKWEIFAQPQIIERQIGVNRRKIRQHAMF
ncbi:hypothetical protein, partial [Campylobacter coli]|uniref:hypothetical protein n=1 Tax=Campylobacter coli TaxID=195 RepID=UPI003F7B36F6